MGSKQIFYASPIDWREDVFLSKGTCLVNRRYRKSWVFVTLGDSITRGRPMHSLVLRYRSGEEIRKGDRVLFFGNPAEIEQVACDPNDPEDAWYMSEYGGGVMILDPMVSGRTFITTKQLDDDEGLEFVSRAVEA